MLFIKDKKLHIHFKEGNEYIKHHFKPEKIVKVGDYLFVKEPYKEKFKGIHHDNSVTDSGFYNQPYFQPIFNTPFIEVPKGEFFMMGDNRDHSNDSRFWGTVPYKYIVGTPWFVYFSWDKNKNIRWERVFRGMDTINQLSDRYETKHEKGTY